MKKPLLACLAQAQSLQTVIFPTNSQSGQQGAQDRAEYRNRARIEPGYMRCR